MPADIAQHCKAYVLRMNRIEDHIAELTVWLRDGFTAPGDIDTVQQALTALGEALAVTRALHAEAVAKVRRRVRDMYWREAFERARGGA